MEWATLFARKKSFNPKKSLLDNFNELCSLPFFCKPSKESIELANILKICRLNCTTSDTQAKNYEILRNDYAMLELAKMAIQCWLDHRSEKRLLKLDPKNKVKPSRRTKDVKLLLTGIKSMQVAIIQQDQAIFMKNQSKADRWVSPVCSYEYNLKNNGYLPLYNTLKTSHEEAKKKIKQNKNNEQTHLLRPHYAVFAPFLSYLYDANLLSYMIDGLDIGMDLAAIF